MLKIIRFFALLMFVVLFNICMTTNTANASSFVGDNCGDCHNQSMGPNTSFGAIHDPSNENHEAVLTDFYQTNTVQSAAAKDVDLNKLQVYIIGL